MLEGSLWFLFTYDVYEEIQLDALDRLTAARRNYAELSGRAR